MAWTSPRTWVAGEIVTAALLNTHLRDNLLAASVWTSYTPATTITIGNGTFSAAYARMGTTIIFRAQVNVGSTTTLPASSVQLALPFAAKSGTAPVFDGEAYDSSAGSAVPVMGIMGGGTTNVILTVPPTSAGGYNRILESGIPFAFATGDRITINGTYESA
jgi:hypothetical protein